MKNLTTTFFLLITFLSFSANDISYFRSQFEGTTNEAKATKYINTKVEKADLKDKITIEAYKAVVTMRMAEYVYNPFTKLSWFKEGKKMLEKSIKMNRNIENIHLRLMVQLNAPAMVNYSSEINADTDYILKNFEKSSVSTEVKKMILVNLLANEKTGKFNKLAKKYGVK